MQRRRLLQFGLGAAAGLALPGAAFATALDGAETRRLVFDNLHTGEKLDIVYWEKGDYAPDALTAINQILRDWRTGEVHPIDKGLLDLLVGLNAELEATQPYQIVSGFRSVSTNQMLRGDGGGETGVAANSLHMQGMAIDICMEGVDAAHLRDAALTLQRGGVGYYPDFIHVDVGRVRRW